MEIQQTCTQACSILLASHLFTVCCCGNQATWGRSVQKMQECCHLFFLVVDHDDEVDWGVKNVFRLSDSPFKPPDEHLPKSKSLTVLLLMIIALWPPLLVLVDILFRRQITTLIKVRMAFVFGLQTL